MNAVNPTADYANTRLKSLRYPPKPGMPRPGGVLTEESETRNKHVNTKTPACKEGADPADRDNGPKMSWKDPNY